MNLSSDISSLKGIGTKIKQLLQKLNICTVEDMLNYYPLRYERYEDAGVFKESLESTKIAVIAQLVSPIRTSFTKNYKISTAKVSDGYINIDVIWYNQPYISKVIKAKERYIFYAKPGRRGNSYILEHPIVYTEENYKKLAGKLVPVYGLTKGLTSAFFIKYITHILDDIEPKEDFLSDELKKRSGLIDRAEAIRYIHKPGSIEELYKARKRLKFDDFFCFMLSIRLLKSDDIKKASKYNIDVKNAYKKEFLSILPYELTFSQQQSFEDIERDMSSGFAMNRLIQGDVGSGKTIVAIYSMYLSYRNGYQSAIMVPTEVLAKQHYKNIKSLMDRLNNPPAIALLTGNMTKSAHKKIYEDLKAHKIDIIIGTHTLIQDALEFDDIALVITDEQHRFGVKQRQKLSEKSDTIHSMIMSATPIPRTLALILYGDLDISYIKEKPKGRLPIKNCVIPIKDRAKAYKHIISELDKGHQAYIICPLVEESESIEAENVYDYSEKLAKYLPKNYNIGIMHGKMSQPEKDEVMSKFLAKDIDVLVSTTVIEVGVDVPNATFIMIEDAQRFGLASLHQLRGRVGRSMYQSYCVFVCTTDSDTAKKRLDIIASSNDGFFISEEDLKLRGPGDLFGLIQSGDISFDLADIHDDKDILNIAVEAIKLIEQGDISQEDKLKIYRYIDSKMAYKIGSLTL